MRLEPDNAQTRLLLGQVLYQLRDQAGARTQLETAFAKSPDFGTGYLLGKTDLLLHDDKAARALFESMLRQWGDTAVNHIFIGRAYSQCGYSKEAADEFGKAFAIDPRARGAHYQLGLSYLRDDEAAGYYKAVPEFRAELALNPDDFPSHYMLGYIAVKQGKWEEAEKELLLATVLNPKDLQALLALAETYTATSRPKNAESTLPARRYSTATLLTRRLLLFLLPLFLLGRLRLLPLALGRRSWFRLRRGRAWLRARLRSLRLRSGLIPARLGSIVRLCRHRLIRLHRRRTLIPHRRLSWTARFGSIVRLCRHRLIRLR